MSAQYTKDTVLNVNTLCIPRVFPNIRENRIRGVINALQMCDIEKIDMVSRVGEKGEKYNRVFIHIKKWYDTANALSAQERLVAGKDIKIVYDDPWFWKVSAYRKTLPIRHAKPPKQAPHIIFDDEVVEPKSPEGPPPPMSTTIPFPSLSIQSEDVIDREYHASVGAIIDYGKVGKAIPKKKTRRPILAVSPVEPLSIRDPDELAAVSPK